jgi:hypothetical protein
MECVKEQGRNGDGHELFDHVPDLFAPNCFNFLYTVYSRFHLSPFSIPCFPSETRLFLTESCSFLFLGRKERDHLEDQGVGGKMGSEWILGRLAWGVWIGFDWLRIGGGLL